MCYNELLVLIESKLELIECKGFVNPALQLTYKECITFVLDSNPNLQFINDYIFKINTILDYVHDQLNIGHWSKVPVEVRQAFTACSFVKALMLLRDPTKSVQLLEEALKCIDLGLLLGAPLFNNPELLIKSASLINEKLNKSTNIKCYIFPRTKRKHSQCSSYDNIKAIEVKTEKCPSIEHFREEYFIPGIPVKLTECMNHWPAMQKWTDITYLLSVAGNRTVPVEIGSHYVDENWTQKLMPFREFVEQYFLLDDSNSRVGYLAQHNLFDQISELQNDICIPEYCCLSTHDNEPDVNAWFGPKNTVSPLHYDPKHNILAQVFGSKQLVLFAPKDSDCLYPHDDRLLNNTAQVNPLGVDMDKYPLFPNATMYKCLLSAGEMLFMPEKWWHHVTALERSFSVSFWWD